MRGGAGSGPVLPKLPRSDDALILSVPYLFNQQMGEAATGMTEHPGFGVMLAWLLEHRGLGVQELAHRAGVTADEVQAVLAGEAPGEGLHRRIAPAVRFHAVDLFLLAGLVVPDDMAPLDAAADRWAPDIVMNAVHLPVAERRELLQLIRSLPQEERPSVFAAKRLASHAGPGGWVIRMFQYRKEPSTNNRDLAWREGSACR